MITIILVVYKSDKKKLNKILKAIGTKYNLIIVDNSLNYNFDLIKLPKRTKIIRSINNGNGSGINIALKNCKTKFAIYFDIDVEFERKFIDKFIYHSKKIKNFSILIPNHGKNKEKKLPIKYYIGEASVMLFNNRILKKIGFFDENFFLYYEDDDFFLKCNSNNLKLFLVTKSLIKHKKTKTVRKTLNLHSTTFSNFEERNSTFFVGGWHGQWSKFYFFKKNYGLIFALRKCLPNNVFNKI